jgi:hypothetical protein
MVTCIGCDKSVASPAAFAIMHTEEFAALGIAPSAIGPDWPGDPLRSFGAGPVCGPCHADPAKRTRPLKAHFALPGSVDIALATAGSHGAVSMGQ